MPAVGVHGLSAQFGALRPLLCATAWEISVANYIVTDAVTWRAWHGRRRREKMERAVEKWSFDSYSHLSVRPRIAYAEILTL